MAGFLPFVTTDPPADAHHIDLTVAYRQVLGLYLVNVLHSLTHLAFGFAGLAAYVGYLIPMGAVKAGAAMPAIGGD